MKNALFLFLLPFCANAASAQAPKDTADGRFHDDLLDHLVGEWKANTVAHDFSSTAVITGAWVLNHQFFFIHLKGNETIPWWGMPMEYQQFVGYNHSKKRYNFHGMSIEGDADTSEGFGYGSRNGNELKMVAKMNADTSVIQRFVWNPAGKTWNIKSTAEIHGKELPEVFLEMKLETIKP